MRGVLSYVMINFFMSLVDSSEEASPTEAHTLCTASESVPGDTPCWSPSWVSSHCHRHGAGFAEVSTSHQNM